MTYLLQIEGYEHLSRDIAHGLWNWKVHYPGHKMPPVVILKFINLVHIFVSTPDRSVNCQAVDSNCTIVDSSSSSFTVIPTILV